MNIRALETLVQILSIQSFSAAAKVKNMTLSAVSMQMRSIEAELDVEMFDRQSRPPRLTPLGRQIAERARSIIAERDSLISLCHTDSEIRGTFLLGFIQTASVRVLPRFLALAKVEAPNAEFQFSAGISEDLTSYVENGRIDGAVVTQVESVSATLDFQIIAEEEMILAAPRNFEGVSITEISQELPFIHFRPTTGIGKLISTAIAKSPDKPEKQLILDSIDGALECVKLGLGYTVLPKPDVERYQDERIATSPAGDRFPNRNLVFVTRSDDQSARWCEQLAKLLKTAAAS